MFSVDTFVFLYKNINFFVVFCVNESFVLYEIFSKMQRPNFQMIEDAKNYMRYVSQYKLDDMVTLILRFFKIYSVSYSWIFSDGKIEIVKL